LLPVLWSLYCSPLRHGFSSGKGNLSGFSNDSVRNTAERSVSSEGEQRLNHNSKPERRVLNSLPLHHWRLPRRVGSPLPTRVGSPLLRFGSDDSADKAHDSDHSTAHGPAAGAVADRCGRE